MGNFVNFEKLSAKGTSIPNFIKIRGPLRVLFTLEKKMPVEILILPL
jgi:hypothetical protein